jgi:hypothetical protein
VVQIHVQWQVSILLLVECPDSTTRELVQYICNKVKTPFAMQFEVLILLGYISSWIINVYSIHSTCVILCCHVSWCTCMESD